MRGRGIMVWLTVGVGCFGLSGCGSTHLAVHSDRSAKDPPAAKIGTR
jgi:hypothetical protein